MPAATPEKLRKSPLAEVLFELRFEPATEAAGDLLPGLLYPGLREPYPEVAPLPLASVPRLIRDQTPEFLYKASHQLRGGANTVQLGDRVVAVSAQEYPGWRVFKARVQSVLESLRATGLVRKVTRFSFRYINVIPMPETEPQLPLLNLRVEVIGGSPLERGFYLRLEHDEEGTTSIIQVAPRTTAKSAASGREVSGLLVDVDTLRPTGDTDFFTAQDHLLESGHSVAKRLFFSLLTEATLASLEPEW